MRFVAFFIAFIIAVLIFPFVADGAQEKGPFERLQEVDSRRLLEKGENRLSKPEGADSALMCFSIVGACYTQSSSVAEKEMAVKALRGKWLVYFSYLIFSRILMNGSSIILMVYWLSNGF